MNRCIQSPLLNRPRSPGRSVIISAPALVLLATFCWLNACTSAAAESAPAWVLTPGPRGSWTALVSSADGTRLAALERDQGLYISADSGARWTLTDSPPIHEGALASSADGLRIVAAGSEEASGIYISRNGGETWIETGAPRLGWRGLANSADGSQLLASPAAAGPVYRSTDGGSTWAKTESPSGLWVSLAMSADGKLAMAASVEPDAIYRSRDGGQTWKEAATPPLAQLGGIAVSADGSRSTAVTRGESRNGSIYTSADAGESWIKTSAPQKDWVSVASSADGSRLVAAAELGIFDPELFEDGGEIYTSTDGGTNWIRNEAPAEHWLGVVSSSDGGKLAAVPAWISGAGGSGGQGPGIYTVGTTYQPWIIEEPLDRVISAGTEAAFRVGAEGGSLSYQWQRDGTNLVDGASLSGTRAPALILSNVSNSDIGSYSVRVMNSAGEIVSTAVRLLLTTWTRSPDGSGSSVAISADGTRLAAAQVFSKANGFYGALLLSADGGNTWTNASAVPDEIRGPVAMSSDGSRIAAGGLRQLYLSSDSGVTWNRAGPGGFWNLTCSPNGQTLVAIQEGEMQISHDFGVKWKIADQPDAGAANLYWKAAACSADGKKLVAATGSSTVFWAAPAPIFASADGGETWQRTPAPAGYWECVASSADGSTLAAASFTAQTVPPASSTVPGSIHVSRDSGAAWTRAALPEMNWTDLACSADGTQLAAASGAYFGSPGKVYLSNDAGATWFMAGAPDGDWSSITCSADGARVAAAMSDGSIWLSPAAAHSPAGLGIARAGVGVALSWPASAAGRVLQQCSDLGTREWSVVSESPIFRAGEQSISITPSSGRNFFRLVQP